MQTQFQFSGNSLLLRPLNSTPHQASPPHQGVSSFFSETGNPFPSQKTVKGYPYPKTQCFRASETCQHIRSKTVSHSFQGSIPSSIKKFDTTYFYGEEAGEKIPIKTLPQEFQKSGLKPIIPSVYIFQLCNVTSEKKRCFFGHITTHNSQGSSH